VFWHGAESGIGSNELTYIDENYNPQTQSLSANVPFLFAAATGSALIDGSTTGVHSSNILFGTTYPNVLTGSTTEITASGLWLGDSNDMVFYNPVNSSGLDLKAYSTNKNETICVGSTGSLYNTNESKITINQTTNVCGDAYYLGYNVNGTIAYLDATGSQVTQSVAGGDSTALVLSGSFQILSGGGSYYQSDILSTNTVTPSPTGSIVDIQTGTEGQLGWAFYNYVGESGWRAEFLNTGTAIETMCVGKDHVDNIQIYNFSNYTITDTEVDCLV
jgi:hypothetical protein